MASIISPENYELLADYYSDLRAQLDGAVHYLHDAAELVVELDDFEPTIDLVNPFYDVYVAQTQVIQSNAGLLSAVRALNNHVIRRSGLASINAYFEANDILISDEWAAMCEDAGHAVDDDYLLSNQ